MIQELAVVSILFSFSASISVAAVPNPQQGKLSAAAIVSRNVAARGGLQAWRAVKAISIHGSVGAGGNQRATLAAPVPMPGKPAAALPTDPRPKEEVQLPFVMEMQRPHKVRWELQFKGQTAVQVYDGANGWKLRPYLNRSDVEPYSSEEMKEASMQAELDGPLVDYQAKGTTIELESAEKVEDNDTYKLKLTMKDGNVRHVWIDAHTFLETKIEGQPRRLDGADHSVEVYYRDYRSVNGLQVPFVLETRVLPLDTKSRVRERPIPTEKIIIDKVEVNPKLGASVFAKPEIGTEPNHRS
jgi:hypothetical protein